MPDSFLAEGRKGLDEYVRRCVAVVDVSPKKLETAARGAVSYYAKSEQDREALRPLRRLETRWYESLRQDRSNPDFDVYNDPIYLADLWGCWIVYSRKYLMGVRRALPDLDPDSILDLGCGCGYTTAALAEMYPRARVVGTQLRRSPQFEVARGVGEDYGFEVVEVASSKFELVFASEYFEHFREPVDHLDEILRVADPEELLVANAFAPDSIGHFDRYRINGAWIKGRRNTSRLFNSALRRRGYRKIQTGLWNQRPTYWRRLETTVAPFLGETT